MGSSKKHKEKDKEREREPKKKRRNRSSSPSEEKVEAKRHRRQNEEDNIKTERSDRLDSHRDPPPKEEYKSHSRKERKTEREIDPQNGAARDKAVEHVKEEMAADYFDSEQAPGGEGENLSIEETNKLRAKLGLKPLDVGDGKTEDGEKPPKKEDVHVPAVNWGEEKRTKTLREKLDLMKEKRKIKGKLSKIKTLGDDSDDDDASNWVEKSRKKEKQKKEADKRAKILEEMENDFGIEDMVKQEFGELPDQKYTSKDLAGLTVQHDVKQFKSGKSVILTLDDKEVLGEDQDDTLVNVNLQSDEVAARNVFNKTHKAEYKAWEDEYDEDGNLKNKELLTKYNEVIDGEMKKKFKIHERGTYDAEEEKRRIMIKQSLIEAQQTLEMPAPQIAKEFFTEAEMSSFKKVKKKVRKVRKRQDLKPDDLVPMTTEKEDDLGSRRRGRGKAIVKEEPDAENSNKIEDDNATEVERALEKNRRLLTKKTGDFEALAEKVKARGEERDSDQSEGEFELPEVKKTGANILLDSTSEFCRTLGEIPTYGMSGNRADEDEEMMMDFEREQKEKRLKEQAEDEMETDDTGWRQVEIDTKPVDIVDQPESILDEEPTLRGMGISSALDLATKKGYLQKEEKKPIGATIKHALLQAKNWSIEDKKFDDLDEKFKKRDRWSGGITTSFSEKEGYKPDVKLEYVDEAGRQMNQKEAFRILSHRFHGKGSGKTKTEKRSKKIDMERQMRTMSSTDTPLGTLDLLQKKQKKEKSAFVVLSGNKQNVTTLRK